MGKGAREGVRDVFLRGTALVCLRDEEELRWLSPSLGREGGKGRLTPLAEGGNHDGPQNRCQMAAS